MTLDQAKNVGDAVAVGLTVGVVLKWLPAVAAALTIVYTLIRIWESATARRLLRAVCGKCAAWWD